MANPLQLLAETVSAARGLWTGEDDLEALEQRELVALNAQLSTAQRALDGARARVAREIARQSSPDLGPEGLAKKQGFRTPESLIAATTGTTVAEASRLLQVGEATTPRRTFEGEPPARRPHVAKALAAGLLRSDQAAAIIALLDRIAVRVDAAVLDRGEQDLVAQAAGMAMNDLARLLLRAETALDPAGVAERENQMKAKTGARMYEDKFGMLHVEGVWDPENGAPIKVAIESYVRAQLQAARGDTVDPDAPRRTVPQMQADAVTRLAQHLLGCERRDVPVEGATVVVRIDLADLESGDGYATIDGLAAPVTAATARRMAASGGVIPCVLGGDSEILDWGRRQRLFTLAQRLALVERDGGCAMCGVPPSHAKAHHLRWWARDAGPTDLANGVLLCESCHHRIHDNGWEIRIDGAGTRAKVWFLPPPGVDPARTPRLGGRARFDLVA